MRNLSEQKKTYSPLIALFFMAIIYAVIFVVLYLGYFNIDATIGGLRFYDFEDAVVRVDDYDVDEGDRMFYIEQGSKVLVREVSTDELAENDVIAFYYKDGTETVIVTQIFKRAETGIDGETVYYVHDLDDPEIHSVNIASGRLMGVYVFSIPVLGTISAYLTSSAALAYCSLIGLALIMLGIPIIVFVIRIKQRRIGSPYPEGVNVNKLKTENLYIYENIRSFFLSAGVFRIEKGYDCDLIYLGKTLFAVLHCTNGNMYVNINKNYQRYDGKIDRAGYICIPHASNLESAKKRINSIYRAYFMDKRPLRRRRPAGARAPQGNSDYLGEARRILDGNSIFDKYRNR